MPGAAVTFDGGAVEGRPSQAPSGGECFALPLLLALTNPEATTAPEAVWGSDPTSDIRGPLTQASASPESEGEPPPRRLDVGERRCLPTVARRVRNPHRSFFVRFRHARVALEQDDNTDATAATLVKLFHAESVEAGGSRRRWRAHPALSPHPVMRSASLTGRARCGCRSVPGNVGVGTSLSAGPRALQSGGKRARMAPRRAPWRRGGRLEFGGCLAQRGRPSQPRMARQKSLALLAVCRCEGGRATSPGSRARN
eukprot:scaffold4621_cov128-Isochrysis_galbana.AAC.8